MADSVPEDDGLKTKRKNRGKGSRTLYIYNGKAEMIKSGISSYVWPLVLLTIVLLVLVAWKGLPSHEALPWWVWSTSWYWLLGAFLGLPLAGILLFFWREPSGVEVWDVGPASDEHRHMRIGNRLWERMEVISPWDAPASKGQLQECRINGRRGYEVMDLRIRDNGTPVCVCTWMGEASEAALRTYRMSLIYARRILSRKAEKAEMLEANREHIIREVAERQVYQMIETSERSGLPDGDAIDRTVSDVLEDLGIDDRMDPDHSLDVEELDDINAWEPGETAEKTNGHGGDDPDSIREMILND